MRHNLSIKSISEKQLSDPSSNFKISKAEKGTFNFSVLMWLIIILMLFRCSPPTQEDYRCYIRYTAQDWPYRYYCGPPNKAIDYSEYTFPVFDKNGNKIVWSEKTESIPVDGCFDCDVYSRIPEVIVKKPESRVYHDLIYDKKSKQVFLIGGTPGWGGDNQCRDVWAYDVESNVWAQRSSNLSVYDPTGGHIKATSPVLIENSGALIVFNNNGETWSYSLYNDEWKNLNPKTAPSARFGHVMTFDSFHQRIILFGGSPRDSEGITSYKNDTWTYNYALNAWKEMHPKVKPRKRIFAGMAFNSNSNRAILWGGGFSELTDNTMWEYDLSLDIWQNIPYNGAPPNTTYLNPRMMYDEQNNELLIIYGIISSNDLFPGQLKECRYSFTSNSWVEIEVKDQPPAAVHFAAALDAKERKIVLFGGFTSFSPTRLLEGIWILDLERKAWQKR